MSELKLINVKAKVAHVQGRQELNGDEYRLACDIRLEMDLPNRVLDQLDTRLLETFYWRNPALVDTKTETIEGVEQVYPNLRFEHLHMPLKWNERFDEGLFVMPHGDEVDADVRLGEVKINEITLFPKEGGTVHLSVRIQAHPDEEDLVRMFTVMQRVVTVTVDTDPEDEEEQESEAPAAEKKPARGRRKKGEAVPEEQVGQIAQAMTEAQQKAEPNRKKKGQQADVFDDGRVEQIKEAMTAGEGASQ
ncbi:hypothetical protein [Trinickia mobilis]|uniref:hypothetical protein n=1 Tax=Trinickia mobilis TaxID=2816356 RepID=UPI001A8CB7FA|nr:hypothetical protein [Trinickia mobilis]